MNSEKIRMQEREISLADLCVEILLHWRSLVAVMLGGGILFGVFGYMKSLQSLELQYEQPAITNEEELRSKLTESQLGSVDIAIAYRKLYEDYSGSRQNLSVLTGDDFVVYNAQMTFWVESEDMERSYNIAKVYKNKILTEDVWEPESMNFVTEGIISAVLEEGSNVLLVTIEHSDEEYCKEAAAAVAEFVENLQELPKMQNELGAHSVGLMSSSGGKTSKESNLMTQKNYIDQVINLKKTCESLENALSVEEKAYFDYLVAEDEQEAFVDANAEAQSERGAESQSLRSGNMQNNMLPEPPLPRVSVKYILIGMLLFAFAEVFFLFLKYILNSRLRTADNLQEIYNIPLLGQIEFSKKSKPLGFVDERIRQLRMRGKRQFTQEEAINLAAIAVKMAAKRDDAKTVCLTGCDLKAEVRAVCEYIKEILEAEDIRVEILGNILYDAGNMEKLFEMSNAVLVETAGVTFYEEIVSELEMMGRQNIKVLGCVVVT